MIKFLSLSLNEGFSRANHSSITQRVIDLIIPTTFGKPYYDTGLQLPTPDIMGLNTFLRENIQMSYDRVPTHAFTLMISYNFGKLALRVKLDDISASSVWISPKLIINGRSIFHVFLKHVVEYKIVDLMIPSISTSLSVSISVSMIIPIPVYHAISIWKTQYKPFKFIYFFYHLMSSKSKLIAVSEKTYHDLAEMGTLEDSFNSVIERMIQKQKAASSQQPFQGSDGPRTAAPLNQPNQSRRSKRVT